MNVRPTLVAAIVILGCQETVPRSSDDDAPGSGGSTVTGGSKASGGALGEGGGGGDGGAVATLECSKLSESECEAESECRVILGQAYDVENECILAPPEAKGCSLARLGCPAWIVLASDPDGRPWLFDACVPPGWPLLNRPALTTPCE